MFPKQLLKMELQIRCGPVNPLMPSHFMHFMQYHIDQNLLLKMLFPFVRVVQRGRKSSFFTSRNIRFSPIVSNKSSGMFMVISTSRTQKCSFINPMAYVIVESELRA
jgi:hypothetical protein